MFQEITPLTNITSDRLLCVNRIDVTKITRIIKEGVNAALVAVEV